MSYIDAVAQAAAPPLEDRSPSEEEGADEADHEHIETLHEPSSWSCQQCTFLNHALLLTCEMCEAPRPVPTAPCDDGYSRSDGEDDDGGMGDDDGWLYDDCLAAALAPLPPGAAATERVSGHLAQLNKTAPPN
jgi:hypothetical protein